MDDDLHALGEDLITTAARVVRWVPKENGFSISLAAARLLARLQDNGPTRISDLALTEKCSQPTITNHVKRLEAAHLVERAADSRDARAWMIKLTKKATSSCL
jgi:DNA-binding MarR family transcriptional regulator